MDKIIRDRKESKEKFEEGYGFEYKKIRWNKICIQTKERPSKPTQLIEGEVQSIYPTGDIAFKKITKILTWNIEENIIKEIKIPEIYKQAKKIVFRREIIANVLYLEELKE